MVNCAPPCCTFHSVAPWLVSYREKLGVYNVSWSRCFFHSFPNSVKIRFCLIGVSPFIAVLPAITYISCIHRIKLILELKEPSRVLVPMPDYWQISTTVMHIILSSFWMNFRLILPVPPLTLFGPDPQQYISTHTQK